MSSVDDSDPKKIIFQDLCSYNQSPTKDFNDYISDDEGACGGAVNNDNDTNNAIAEVSDVFPNLGSGYIKRLIDYFGTSENVISALLEGKVLILFINNLNTFLMIFLFCLLTFKIYLVKVSFF